MANTPTLSLRVPPEHHDLVRAVVARLKADTNFADTLRTLLPLAPEDTASAASLPNLHDLMRRLDAVEAWIADHGAEAPPGIPVHTAVSTVRSPLPPHETEVVPAPAVTQPASQADREPWTFGTGTAKRLSPAGRAELVRRHRLGESDIVIAAALDVSPFTVRKWRAVDASSNAGPEQASA